MHDIILKNNTGADISIRDLSGLTIPASGQIDITGLFPYDRLANSEDLMSYTSVSGIIVNFGGVDVSASRVESYLSYKDAQYIKGVPIGDDDPELQATLSGGYVMEYDGDEIKLDFKPYELKSLRDVNINPDGTMTIDGVGGGDPIIPDMAFLDLNDTPTTYSGSTSYSVLVTSSGTLEFSPAASATIIQSDTPPDPNDANLWYNTIEHDIYYYDDSRGKWLTTAAHNYVFSRAGSVDGAYLGIDAITHSSAHYWMPRDATLTGIISNMQLGSGPSNKTFEVRNDTTTLSYFTHTNYVYQNLDVNVDIDLGSLLKLYVDNVAQGIRNPIVILEIRWRYDTV